MQIEERRAGSAVRSQLRAGSNAAQHGKSHEHGPHERVPAAGEEQSLAMEDQAGSVAGRRRDQEPDGEVQEERV